MPSKSTRYSKRSLGRHRGRWTQRPIGTPGGARTLEPTRFSPLEENFGAGIVLGGSPADQIARYRGAAVAEFLEAHLGEDFQGSRIFWNVQRREVESIAGKERAIGVLEKMNCARWVNKYIRAVNWRLEHGGIFAGCVEVNEQRKSRLLKRYPSFAGSVCYYVDCAIHRIWPKLPFLNKAYFALAKHGNRSISTAEILGRLVSCGFEIVDHREISSLTYFAARKVREADVVRGPTYGPICGLHRVGRGERTFKVYKFRTMHPYSEFLQEYVYRMNHLDAGGKFKDDFRIPPWGRLMRRFWIDELPMIVNVLRGEIKLVGVRPLSLQYFSLYPSELQKLRRRHTPGLLPPFYVDLPKELDEIVASELKYLRAYEKAPLRTDLRYLCLGTWNILAKRARSA